MMPLTILHTNDLHGQFNQMTRLATVIARERALAAAEGRAALLVDAGDSSGGAWESSVTQGRANFIMLEAMGYHAATLGNAETGAFTGEAIQKIAAAVHFPIVLGNVTPPYEGIGQTAVLSAGDVQVGVIGVSVAVASDRRYEVASQTIQRLAPRLRAEGVNWIVVLSHLGAQEDRALARNAADIHLIVGGHTHTALQSPEIVGAVAVAQAGSHGQYLGRVDLLPEGGVSGKLIACDDSVPPDPTLSGMLELVRFEAESLKKSR